MEVGSGDPAAPAHGADPLASRHDLTLPHVCPIQMKVRGDQTRPVIDVYGTARQIEIRYQSHHAFSGCSDRRTDGTSEVGPQMAALDLTVEDARGTKRACNPAGSRKSKRPSPEPRPFLG
jgi:hypothetical protein